MNGICKSFFFTAILLSAYFSNAQVNRPTEFKLYGGPVDQPFQTSIFDITQDKEGYLWIADATRLYRFDGENYISYFNENHKSPPGIRLQIECIAVDSSGILWIGWLGSGLESLDPKTGKFNQYMHSIDEGSLSNDTVAALLVDDQNRVWAGTHQGLDLFDKETKIFNHYRYSPNDAATLSDNQVRALYMDRRKDIWVGTRSPFPNDVSYPNLGGLNKLVKGTNRFVRYQHDDNDPGSIADNHVRAIFEDSRGNFWVGTGGSGINKLNRETGKFERFTAGKASGNLTGLPAVTDSGNILDHITFISEDGSGALWFGSLFSGIIRYDPATGKQDMLPYKRLLNEINVQPLNFWRGFTTQDGNFCFTTFSVPAVIKIDPFTINLPFQLLRSDANSFYEDAEQNIWIGHTNGLIRKDHKTGTLQQLFGDSIGRAVNANTFNSNSVVVLRGDALGNIWLGKATNGLEVFDPRTGKVKKIYRADSANQNTITSPVVNALLFENNNILWIGTEGGLDRLDISKQVFTHFKNKSDDQASLINNSVYSLTKDPNGRIWVGTSAGASMYNASKNTFERFLSNMPVLSLFCDTEKQLWAGTDRALYKYDEAKQNFFPFQSSNSAVPLVNILNILEDNDRNLWVSTGHGIFKLNPGRDTLLFFGKDAGIIPNTFLFADNLKTSSGEIFLGHQNGYYQFDPRKLSINPTRPLLRLTDFRLNGNSVLNTNNKLARIITGDSGTIVLNHNENVFSIDFNAVQFREENAVSYLFKLEGYDNEWRKSGEKRAYYFNVSPGDYRFIVRAFFSNGVFSEKQVLLRIDKPWWQSWLAYVLFAIGIALVIWGIVQFRSRTLRREKMILEARVKERTAEVVKQKEEIEQQKDEIEQTLQELKVAQDQLVQKEKMASLGELTAGIAHEIQNPLNFVNNFSEVNNELADELFEEMGRDNISMQRELLNEIKKNNEKITHHGKRADSIVKSMLQHSRISTGQKELTDINALCDEYLRLAYHGIRAKDKTFNANFETALDPAVPKINIVPQDIGRVLLNLVNNAFYAVSEKTKIYPNGFLPTVTVSTKMIHGCVQIIVRDNGNGIPQSIKEKIFQPFFTTKPTGQGTGLGLSLAYDIVKAHGATLALESVAGEGSAFFVDIPI